MLQLVKQLEADARLATPEEQAIPARYVELDSLTARIAHQLYQGAFVVPAGLQEARLPTSHFDLVISNVPFGNYGVTGGRLGSPPVTVGSDQGRCI